MFNLICNSLVGKMITSYFSKKIGNFDNLHKAILSGVIISSFLGVMLAFFVLACLFVAGYWMLEFGYSKYYIISAICHNITRTSHQSVIELSKDSYMVNLNDTK